MIKGIRQVRAGSDAYLEEGIDVIEREVASTALTVHSEDPAPSSNPNTSEPNTRWQAVHELAWHRAETERVKVLVEFLARPIHATAGPSPTPTSSPPTIWPSRPPSGHPPGHRGTVTRVGSIGASHLASLSTA